MGWVYVKFLKETLVPLLDWESPRHLTHTGSLPRVVEWGLFISSDGVVGIERGL